MNGYKFQIGLNTKKNYKAMRCIIISRLFGQLEKSMLGSTVEVPDSEGVVE